MKNSIRYWIMALTLPAMLLSSNFTYADAGDFELSVRNQVQTAPNKLEFDVYLLDTDPLNDFYLSTEQFGILFNSLIYAGGTVSIGIDNTGSGLGGSQIMYQTPKIETDPGYPNRTLIVLAGELSRIPLPECTLISKVSPGTLITHFVLTSTVSFAPGSTPDLVFTSGTDVTPLYATRIVTSDGSGISELPTISDGNAVVYGNPSLNAQPAAFNVTGGGTYCEGGEGLPVGLDGSETGVTYTLLLDGAELSQTISGTGAAISFGNQTVAGVYTVEGTNTDGTTPMIGSATIIMNPLPAAAGTITGTAAVCQGQSAVSYSVGAITNATSYTWTYSGTGATISGTTNPVTIDFSSTATSGDLTVRGVNSCGNGTVSANYPITVNPLPEAAGTITGTASVCQGATSIGYSVGAITNATSYTWTYSGTGATISGTTNPMTIDFSSTATSGNLTVYGTNTCGNGLVSANYPITVNATNTVGAASSTPTLCINTALTPITHTTSGATGIGTATGLPSGVTAAWATNTITISGTPAAAGTFNYTIPLTGGCGIISATGTITVTAANTITLTSAVGTDNQIRCINTAITNITYSTTGAAGATFSGLPTGVSGDWASNVVTISGTPTIAETYNYTVTLTGGCGTVTANGTITVNDLPVTSEITGNAAPPCSGTGLVYSVINTSLSTYSWTVPTGATITGGQGSNSITVTFGTTNGNIAVTETNEANCTGTTRTLAISLQGCGLDANFDGTPRTICVGSSVTFTNTSIGTTAGTAYNWNFGSGATPDIANTIGPHTVTYNTTGSKTVSLTITEGASDTETQPNYITVNPVNTISLTSGAGTDNQTVCPNTAITTITYSTTSATGATISGLPTGVNGSWVSNVVNISGIPTISGTYNYTVTLTGGCGAVSANGTINVNPCTKTLNLTLFLEGLYNGANGLVKVQDCDDGENAFDLFSGIVADTLTVELAQTTSPYTTDFRQHGVPVNTNGTVSLTSVPAGLSGNYHIVIKHRNHVETWSQSTSFAGSSISYNFTDAINKAWGNNMVLVGSSYCMYTGDTNMDEYVDGFDIVITFNLNKLASFGFQVSDINGDGFIDGFDMIKVFNNNKKAVGMNTPLAPLKK